MAVAAQRREIVDAILSPVGRIASVVHFKILARIAQAAAIAVALDGEYSKPRPRGAADIFFIGHGAYSDSTNRTLVKRSCNGYITGMAVNPETTIRKLVSFPRELAAEIDEFRFANRIKTESGAIRKLVELGLSITKKDATKKARR